MAKQNDAELSRIVETRRMLLDQSPWSAGSLTYIPSVFCQLSLPIERLPGASQYTHDTGHGFRMNIFTDLGIGIPFGCYPRGILAYIAQQVTVKKNAGISDPQIVELGTGVVDFLENVSGTRESRGGDRGNLTMLRRQMRSLSASAIQFIDYEINAPTEWVGVTNYSFVHQAKRVPLEGPQLWTPSLETKEGKIVVHLGDDFYFDLVEHSVPFDARVLKALWPSCLRIDIATWLTYRSNKLEMEGGSLNLSWDSLRRQFGVNYSDGARRLFKQRFREAFAVVRQVYDPSDPDCIGLEDLGDRVVVTVKRPMVVRREMSEPYQVVKQSRLPATARAFKP
jgi:Plasmid encoded RepA protein